MSTDTPKGPLPQWTPIDMVAGVTAAEACDRMARFSAEIRDAIHAQPKCGDPTYTSLGDVPCLKPSGHKEPCQ